MFSTNSSFDPKSQPITMLMPDGTTPFTFLASEISSWDFENVRSCISFGTQLGAFAVMFIMTAVLTRSNKRRSPIFILNLLSLMLGFLDALLHALFYESTWHDFYRYFAEDYTDVPVSAYAVSILNTVIMFLFTLAIVTSLVFQAYTVTRVMAQKWHIFMTCASVIVLLLSVGFRFATMILNCMVIVHLETFYSFQWLQTGTLATETIAIWYFNIIFTGKLVWTMWIRRTLGFRSWSYIQVLAIMGGCTMILPSIFATLEYINIAELPTVATWATSLVALLLPFSALWASMVTTEATSSFKVQEIWTGNVNEKGNGNGNSNGNGNGNGNVNDNFNRNGIENGNGDGNGLCIDSGSTAFSVQPTGGAASSSSRTTPVQNSRVTTKNATNTGSTECGRKNADGLETEFRIHCSFNFLNDMMPQSINVYREGLLLAHDA